jgi:hypothetical protein
MEVSGQLYAPAALPPRERVPGTHWIGGRVDPRSGLDAAVMKRKFPSSSRESNLPMIHPVAQRYTTELSVSYRYDPLIFMRLTNMGVFFYSLTLKYSIQGQYTSTLGPFF